MVADLVAAFPVAEAAASVEAAAEPGSFAVLTNIETYARDVMTLRLRMALYCVVE